jgi:hypothetical protein
LNETSTKKIVTSCCLIRVTLHHKFSN